MCPLCVVYLWSTLDRRQIHSCVLVTEVYRRRAPLSRCARCMCHPHVIPAQVCMRLRGRGARHDFWWPDSRRPGCVRVRKPYYRIEVTVTSSVLRHGHAQHEFGRCPDHVQGRPLCVWIGMLLAVGWCIEGEANAFGHSCAQGLSSMGCVSTLRSTHSAWPILTCVVHDAVGWGAPPLCLSHQDIV